MIVEQKVKEAEITEQDSLLLTRNLLRIAIFNISYIRGLFPEALEMKIEKFMHMDAESRKLIEWMEKGVYDALQKKYLRTLMFCVCKTVEGPIIEKYSFSFSYSNSESQEVSMNVNRIGNKKQGETFKCNSTTEITPNQMKNSACKMVPTLIQLMRTLDKMPEERTILMKLLYYDDVTPADYEPPFFKGCTEEEAYNPWNKNLLKMEVENVNSKHFVLSLKVKSVLDPCEDDNMSVGGDSMDSEANLSDDEYIMTDKEKPDDTMADEGPFIHTSTSILLDWINSYHLDNLDVTDVLSNFPDISPALIEEELNKLVNKGVLSKSGNESFNIKRPEKTEYEFDDVKEEGDNKIPSTMLEGQMYMKALFHALPMNYITIPKFQTKLGCEVNQTTVRKLMDKMTKVGFIETSNSRMLGKHLIHSEITNKKLDEVRKALDFNSENQAGVLSVEELFMINEGFKKGESNHPSLKTQINIQPPHKITAQNPTSGGIDLSVSKSSQWGDFSGLPKSSTSSVSLINQKDLKVDCSYESSSSASTSPSSYKPISSMGSLLNYGGLKRENMTSGLRMLSSKIGFCYEVNKLMLNNNIFQLLQSSPVTPPVICSKVRIFSNGEHDRRKVGVIFSKLKPDRETPKEISYNRVNMEQKRLKDSFQGEVVIEMKQKQDESDQKENVCSFEDQVNGLSRRFEVIDLVGPQVKGQLSVHSSRTPSAEKTCFALAFDNLNQRWNQAKSECMEPARRQSFLHKS